MNTFRHSGKLGDIIYSLPAVRALGGGTFYVDHVTQYLGKPALGIQSARMMIELLETQDYIHRASLFGGEPITYDLDRFRDKAVPIHVFNIVQDEAEKATGFLFGQVFAKIRQAAIPKLEVNVPQFHWESVGLPGKTDLNVPWIEGIPPKPAAEIVISKTCRHSGTLDWPVLERFTSRCVFVGLEEEWQAFRSAYFDLDFYRVRSLLEFAQVVAGAKLYVGNQSFGLTLAEAMLIPRVAELWESNPIRMSTVRGHDRLTHHLVEAYVNS